MNRKELKEALNNFHELEIQIIELSQLKYHLEFKQNKAKERKETEALKKEAEESLTDMYKELDNLKKVIKAYNSDLLSVRLIL